MAIGKKIVGLLLAAALCCSLAVTGVSASGAVSTPVRSREEIVAKFERITRASTVFDVRPSYSAPYKTGKLNASFIKSGLDYLNFIRYLAGLPEVSLSTELNDISQHGAVLLMANDQLTHYPDQPSNMSDAFYQKGSSATSSSNLFASWGIGESVNGLIDGIRGCMDDDSYSNMYSVGHRRWFLNPTLSKVGFGYAAKNETVYGGVRIFDQSGPAVNYDYVAWPPSGNVPTEVFSGIAPWSVTLNPNKYQTPKYHTVKIKLTHLTTGKVWHFDYTDGTIGDGEFMTVDTMGYGVPNCIIFRPEILVDDKNVILNFDISGQYDVQISGIYKNDGTPATIHYNVDFFDMENYNKLTIKKQPTNAVAKEGETVKTTVEASGVGLQYQWYVKEPGTTNWIKSSVKTATYSYTMIPSKAGRQVYCIITDAYGNSVMTDTVTLKMQSPYITQQPANVVVNVGDTARAVVKAEGKNLRYQWYVKNPGSSVWIQSSIKTNVYSYTMTAAKSGRQVYCVITDGDGNKVKSNTVTLRMPKPKFTQQPADVVVRVGDTATVVAKGSGTGITYQWYFKNPGMGTFSKSSVKKSVYSFEMTAAKSGRQVYCVITDKYGQTVKSNTVTMRMPKPKFTKQPTDAAAPLGKTVKTSVTASGDGLRYQWYFKNADMKTFLKSSVTTSTYSYTMTAAKAGRQVYCVVTDKYGQTVKSNIVTLRKS